MDAVLFIPQIPIVTAFRGSICENKHFASLVVSSLTGNVLRMFPALLDESVYLRSAAKPFQAIPLFSHPSSAELTDEERAIICASHSGSERHVALVREVLTRAGVDEYALQCGPQMPLDKPMKKQLICNGEKPDAIYNNCSGKHAGMLLACRYFNWPRETYLEPEHPLQQMILETIARYSNIPKSQIQIALDGCSAPVQAIPLANIAQMFARLTTEPDAHQAAHAMTAFPEIVGDKQRIDTRIMQVSQGNLIAKVGADGLLAIANRTLQQGLALKCHDGLNEIRNRLIVQALLELEWLDASQVEILRRNPEFSLIRYNHNQLPVGHYQIDLSWS